MTDLIEARRGTTGGGHEVPEPRPITREHGGATLCDPSRLLDDVTQAFPERLRQDARAIQGIQLLLSYRGEMGDGDAELLPCQLQRLPRFCDSPRIGRGAQAA